jgi:hypothetical protein
VRAARASLMVLLENRQLPCKLAKEGGIQALFSWVKKLFENVAFNLPLLI